MKASFMNAYSFCKSLDMELATFETKAEVDWFADMFVNSCSKHDIEWCMVGGIRKFADKTISSTNWFWMQSGNQINYELSWHNGQPDNNNGLQWCLAVSKKGRKTSFFADIECYKREEHFICQKTTSSRFNIEH